MSVPLSTLHFRTEDPADHSAIEALLDRVFGPGRFTKVSERVREVAQARPDLSFCAWKGDVLVGVVRQWAVHVGGDPTIFLGPLAVDQDQRLGGLGAALVQKACEAAGAAPVLLVGDEPYFTRFGFSAAPARGVILPGPVDQRRVLVRGSELSGLVTA